MANDRDYRAAFCKVRRAAVEIGKNATPEQREALVAAMRDARKMLLRWDLLNEEIASGIRSATNCYFEKD